MHSVEFSEQGCIKRMINPPEACYRSENSTIADDNAAQWRLHQNDDNVAQVSGRFVQKGAQNT